MVIVGVLMAGCAPEGSEPPEFVRGIYVYEGERENSCSPGPQIAVSCVGGIELDDDGALRLFQAFEHDDPAATGFVAVERLSPIPALEADAEVLAFGDDTDQPYGCGGAATVHNEVDAWSLETGTIELTFEHHIRGIATCTDDVDIAADCSTVMSGVYTLVTACEAPCQLVNSGDEGRPDGMLSCGADICECP